MTTEEKAEIVINQLRADRDYLETKLIMLREVYEGILGNNTTDFHSGYDAAVKGFIEVISQILAREEIH